MLYWLKFLEEGSHIEMLFRSPHRDVVSVACICDFVNKITGNWL